MYHVVKLVKQRFPNGSGRIITTLALLSASAAALGVGILWSQ